MSHGYPDREEALDVALFNALYKVYIEGSIALDEIGDDEKDAEARHKIIKPFYDMLIRLSNGQKFRLICTLFDRLFEVEQESRFLSMDVTSLLTSGMKINEDVTPGTDDVPISSDNDEQGNPA